MRIGKGKLIGKGLTSDVYEWSDGRVLKLVANSAPAAVMKRIYGQAEREYAITRAVHAAGLPAPATYELVEIDGRKGIVFERIEGPSMFDYVVARPWTLFAAARQLAELHAQLHGVTAPAELPSQREQFERYIAAATFSDDEKEATRRCLDRLPQGDAVCHGDFHPGNILLTKRGPVIIDWSTASRGHPLGDVAGTSMLFEVGGLPEGSPMHIRVLFRCTRALLCVTYLKRYFQLRPGMRRKLDEWRPPVLAGVSAWRASMNHGILHRSAVNT
jgi:uncharacterized protein (TIGR02172 family)